MSDQQQQKTPPTTKTTWNMKAKTNNEVVDELLQNHSFQWLFSFCIYIIPEENPIYIIQAFGIVHSVHYDFMLPCLPFPYLASAIPASSVVCTGRELKGSQINEQTEEYYTQYNIYQGGFCNVMVFVYIFRIDNLYKKYFT